MTTRKTRPTLEKDQRPLRARTASRPKSRQEPTVSEEVSGAVKRGYDIITENIRQGREAAERFRDGEYSLRETPDEMARLTARMMLLAREMSTATFDVVDRVVRELGGAIRDAKDRDAAVPPFRLPGTVATATSADTSRLRVTLVCKQHPKAFGRPALIDRPKSHIGPGKLQVGPFTSRTRGHDEDPAHAAHRNDQEKKAESEAPKAKQASPQRSKKPPPEARIDHRAVTFDVDLSREGVVATVPVPEDIGVGVYSAFVYAKGEDSPLGSITIEVLR